MDQTTSAARPGFWRTWAVALRLYSVPASAAPIAFGTALAYWLHQRFQLWSFVAALTAMVSLHLAANLLNDVGDFRAGVDRRGQALTGSGAIVRGWISLRQGAVVGACLVGLAALIGAVLAWHVGWPLMVLGLVGVAAAVFYTLSPRALKYRGLGDVTVFLSFGSLAALGAWVVQTGQWSWLPVLWSMPLGLLVTGILHLNNWRDRGSDRSARIVTVANQLSERGVRLYFGVLVFGGFLFVGLTLIVTRLFEVNPQMPWSFLLVGLALPLASQLSRRARRYAGRGDTEGMGRLVQGMALLSFAFGLLLVLALMVDVIWR